MKQTIVRDIDQPPGGWHYTVEQTGVRIDAASARSLKSKIRQHLKANNLPLPENFDAWVEDAICTQGGYGNPFCGNAPAKRDGRMPVLSLSMATRFIRTMLGVIRDRKLVSPEEVERRIAICNACPLASTIGGCRGCSTVFRKAKRLLDRLPAVTAPEKEFCGACGCLLQALTWIPNSTLDLAVGSERPPYAAGCWRQQPDTPSEANE